MKKSVARPGFLDRIILPMALVLLGVVPTLGVEGPQPVRQEGPPFALPFEDPPGPSTWYLQQPYGNTVFAYRFRNSTYINGQGLHFGVDLAAPCGTPVLAIGDGVVHSVDNWHGSGPHNLLINHPNGYASFYGHLLGRPRLKAGDEVQKGDVVALSGDPDLTCSSRPHMHLEIRSAPDHRIAYNPLLLIDADWERIALLGGSPILFEQDMEQPRRWQSLFDQPDTHFGYPLLNNYPSAWPLAW